MEYQKCPICNGNGQGPEGFYSRAGDSPGWETDHTIEICRTCEGRGIIIKPSLEKAHEAKTDGLWCPRCGNIFHDSDITRRPEDYYKCPECHVIQHKACRGSL